MSHIQDLRTIRGLVETGGQNGMGIGFNIQKLGVSRKCMMSQCENGDVCLCGPSLGDRS